MNVPHNKKYLEHWPTLAPTNENFHAKAEDLCGYDL